MNARPLSDFLRGDSSAITLILSNLLVIVFAVTFNWSLAVVLWGFWLQNIIIGFFTFFKILLSESAGFFQKIVLAFFFVLHYGLFHFGYAFFLLFFSFIGFFAIMGSPQTIFSVQFFTDIALIGTIFFLNHAFSFYKNFLLKPEERKKRPIELMFEPYPRIIPMHLTIIFAGFITTFFFFLFLFSRSNILVVLIEKIILVFFLLLKTIMDYKGHQAEHNKNISGPFASLFNFKIRGIQ